MSDADSTPEETHKLQCREIWGGTEATETSLSVPGLDVAVISRPFAGQASGGDIHFVGLCGHGVLSRFVVADVSGHDASAAELAGKLHRLMGAHMNTPDQSALARDLNDEFHALAEAGQFATALVMTYDARFDHLITINAGHPRPLWYRRADRTWRPLTHEVPAAAAKLTDLPLGVIAGTGYRQFAVPLGAGDAVLLYTDSLTEARDDAGRLLGDDGLLELVEGLGEPTSPEIAPRLLDAVAGFQNGRMLQDDSTILALHHTAEDPPGAT